MSSLHVAMQCSSVLQSYKVEHSAYSLTPLVASPHLKHIKLAHRLVNSYIAFTLDVVSYQYFAAFLASNS